MVDPSQMTTVTADVFKTSPNSPGPALSSGSSWSARINKPLQPAGFEKRNGWHQRRCGWELEHFLWFCSCFCVGYWQSMSVHFLLIFLGSGSLTIKRGPLCHSPQCSGVRYCFLSLNWKIIFLNSMGRLNLPFAISQNVVPGKTD